MVVQVANIGPLGGEWKITESRRQHSFIVETARCTTLLQMSAVKGEVTWTASQIEA